MEKQELLDEIDGIPHFRLRDAGLKETNAVYDDAGNIMNQQEVQERWIDQPEHRAVTEVGGTKAIAYVSHKYKLVQFATMFKPIVEGFDNCSGKVYYNNGFAIMDVFPESDDYKVDGNKIGIVAYNSVNKLSGLNISFSIHYNNNTMTMPKRVASFRKIHAGKVNQVTKDYIAFVMNVKNTWQTIVTKLSEQEVDKEQIDELLKEFKCGERTQAYIDKKLKEGRKYNVWSLFMEIFKYLANKNYRSDVHKRKRLDKLVERVFDYAMVANI